MIQKTTNRFLTSMINSKSNGFEFKPFPIVLLLIASGLIGWAVSTISPQGLEWLSGITTGVIALLTLCVCVSATTERKGIMMKTCSVIFFICGLTLSIILAAFNATFKSYIISEGLFLVFFGALIYTLYTRKVA